jgi:ABC-type sugar transport system substrate-binding protein
LTLIVLGSILIVGCAPAPTAAPAAPATQAPAEQPPAAPTEAPAKEIIIGHSFPDLQNPYYVSVRDAVTTLMEEAGYTYIVTDSTQDPAKQITDIENLVQLGAAVIFIDAVDPTAVVPAVEAANNANIPVVTLMRKPTGGLWVTNVYLDSIKHGELACQLIVDKLGGTGNVVDLQGILATDAGRDRTKGCMNAFTAAPGINLVAQVPAGWNRTEALDQMGTILEANPVVDGVFGANDEMALGAIQAFKAAGIDPSTKIITGVDGTFEAFEAICKHEMTGTVATFGTEEARIILGLANDVVTGKAPPASMEFEGEMVTLDNMDAMIVKAEYTLDCGALAPK